MVAAAPMQAEVMRLRRERGELEEHPQPLLRWRVSI